MLADNLGVFIAVWIVYSRLKRSISKGTSKTEDFKMNKTFMQKVFGFGKTTLIVSGLWVGLSFCYGKYQAYDLYVKQHTVTKTVAIESVETTSHLDMSVKKYHTFTFLTSDSKINTVTVGQSNNYDCPIFLDPTIKKIEISYTEYDGEFVEITSIKVPSIEEHARFKI